MNNDLISANYIIARDEKLIQENDFINNFTDYLRLYISNGKPSKDTLNTYSIAIKQFFLWCNNNKLYPLRLTDYKARIYLEYLYSKGYKDDSIAIKIIAIRAFFNAAKKIGFVKDNPIKDIKISSSYAQDEMLYYLTTEQIKEIDNVFDEIEDEFIRYRNKAMFYLMAIEGLRNVEIHRLNVEDINFNQGIITIRGKGRNRQCYPCSETMNLIIEYLNRCETSIKDSLLTPLFVSDSNLSQYKRISRNGIRYIIDKALSKVGYKVKGISCHILRHSCGTNLYALEKDLRLVQEVLGHRDPKTTARYAHVQEKVSKRITSKLVPK